MMIVICIVLFSKFDSDVRKDVFSSTGRDHKEGPTKVLVQFEYMRHMVENVKRIDYQNNPVFFNVP